MSFLLISDSESRPATLSAGARAMFHAGALEIRMYYVPEGETVLVTRGQDALLLEGGSGRASKNPTLAKTLSQRLTEIRIEHSLITEFRERHRFLDILKRSTIAVCCPDPEEGFYLPALEAMALGCIVVTNDCIGNRSFCFHEHNCMIAERSVESLVSTTMRVLTMDRVEREKLLLGARASAGNHSLDSERVRFQAVLQDIDQLW